MSVVLNLIYLVQELRVTNGFGGIALRYLVIKYLSVANLLINVFKKYFFFKSKTSQLDEMGAKLLTL